MFRINANANPGFNEIPGWMIHKAELLEFLRKVIFVPENRAKIELLYLNPHVLKIPKV